MKSLIAAAIGPAAAISERVNGETFEFRPFTRSADVNDAPIVDVGRAVTTIVASYRAVDARAAMGPAAHAGVTPERPGHSTDRPFVFVRYAQLTYKPRVGDQLAREGTGELFKVAEVLDVADVGWHLDLNHVS